MSRERFPKFLSPALAAAAGLAVGYLLRESKIKRVNEHLEAARIREMRAEAETSQALELANHDSLTGLFNRRGFEGECQKLYTQIRGNRRGDPKRASMLLLDLDKLKAINDTYGHPAGNIVIQKTAGTIVEQLREGDTVARIGGDELAVLLPDATAADALKIADKIRVAVKDDGDVTLSIGVAEIRPEYPEATVDYADLALYRAKENGRNQIAELSPPHIPAIIH